MPFVYRRIWELEKLNQQANQKIRELEEEFNQQVNQKIRELEEEFNQQVNQKNRELEEEFYRQVNQKFRESEEKFYQYKNYAARLVVLLNSFVCLFHVCSPVLVAVFTSHLMFS